MRYIVYEKQNDFFILSKETLNHIKVNRIKENQQFHCLYNNEYYICKLENNKAKIIEKTNINNEYKNDIIVGLPLIKYKKIDLLIQKLTELGVKEIYLLITKNISVIWNEKDINKKIDRWTLISKAACEQCFRNSWIKIHAPINFEQFIKIYPKYNKYIAHEKYGLENNQYQFSGNLVFLSGPEGGFTDNEIDIAKNNNYKIISLGKRILRSETSILKMVSNINNLN